MRNLLSKNFKTPIYIYFVINLQYLFRLKSHFFRGVKEECIYALCLGLAEDNTILTKEKSHTRKARSYKPKSLEWNNAAIEENRKEEGRENSYHFTHPAQGHKNSNPHLNQKERMGTKGKKDSTPKGRKGIKNQK